MLFFIIHKFNEHNNTKIVNLIIILIKYLLMNPMKFKEIPIL